MANAGGGSGGNAGGVRAGRAYVEIGTEDAGLHSGLHAAEKRLERFGEALTGAGLKVAGGGVGVLTGLGLLANEFVERGAKVQEASERLGESAEKVSALGYAARQSGLDLETVERASNRMAKALEEADEKGGDTAEVLARLGLNAHELIGMARTDQLLALGDALDKVTNPTERAALAMKVAGKSAAELFTLFPNLRGKMAEADLAGAVLSGEQAEAAKKMKESLTRSYEAAKNTVLSFMEVLVPNAGAIEELSLSFLHVLKGVRGWAAENKALVAGVALAAAGAVAFGGALVGVGVAAKVGAAGLAALGTAFKVTAGILSFFVSPAGLALGVLAGLAAAVGYLLATTEKGQGVLAFFAAGWTELADVFETTWGGINDELAAGDLEAAGEIAFAGLRAAWLGLVADLRAFWDDFTHHFVDGWKSAVFLVLDLWRDFLAEVDTHKDVARTLTGAATFGLLGAANDEISDAHVRQRLAEAEAAAKAAGEEIRPGFGHGSPEADAARKAAADARAKLDELAADAAVNRILDGVLKEHKGAADIEKRGGAATLTRGLFGSLGLGSQAFGQGTALDSLPRIAEKGNDLLGEIDAKLGAILENGAVLT